MEDHGTLFSTLEVSWWLKESLVQGLDLALRLH